MVETSKSKLIALSTLLIFLLTGIFLYQYLRLNDGKLHVVFCNVGQGDGIFIRTPKGKDILIDAGPNDSVLSCLSNNMPFWDRDIELIILSHPHQDHARGMIAVLKRYRVLSFATEELVNDTALYANLKTVIASQSIIQSSKLTTKYLYAGDTIKTSDKITLHVLGPSKSFLERTSPSGKINESGEFGSLITLLSYKNFDVLLTSDSQIVGLKEALSLDLPTIEVLQVPHHGSKYGLDEEILSRIKPKIAVISVGKNSYGHPSREVIKILRDLDIRQSLRFEELKVLRTDKNGEIRISSDGEGIEILMRERRGE